MLNILVCCQSILEKYPLLRARLRPEGAAEGGAGGIFSKMFENMPIHVFKVATIPGFPSFRVWPGTQDATPKEAFVVWPHEPMEVHSLPMGRKS